MSRLSNRPRMKRCENWQLQTNHASRQGNLGTEDRYRMRELISECQNRGWLSTANILSIKFFGCAAVDLATSMYETEIVNGNT